MKHRRMSTGSVATVLSRFVGLAASLAVALPALGEDVPFKMHVISTTADGASSIYATDMDGDGDIDVLSASIIDGKIAWYRNGGGTPPTFTERVISTTAVGARSVFAIDVDGDGDTDVLSASFSDDKIAWYESDGGSPPNFTEHVISLTADGASSVFATDVDGDGDTDVLSASVFDNKIAWYENDGGSPPAFSERVISTAAFVASSVFATDVDGDGDIDVLSASHADDKIAWYQSDGDSPPNFTERVISTTAVVALSVFATDVDGDGDTDVLSASLRGSKLAWHESNGGSPPFFAEHVISTPTLTPVSVFAADVDGDGDTDVLSASSGDNKIEWYENNGSSPGHRRSLTNPPQSARRAPTGDEGFPSFTRHLISFATSGLRSVFAADVDGDGDTDVLSASSDGTIAWYENTPPLCGNGSIDLDEECDSGLGCTDCVCGSDFEPMDPPSPNCQPICGNGIRELGEECDGTDAPFCPGGCLSDCTCGPLFCGDGACDSGENSCSCPNDCGVPPASETPGSTCDDGVDNDCDSLIDADDPDCASDVPTVSTWGLIVIALLLLAGAKVRFGRTRRARTM